MNFVTSSAERGSVIEEEDRAGALKWLEARLDAADRERERAVELQRTASEQALERQREAHEQRISDVEEQLDRRLHALHTELLVRIGANKELVEQFNTQTAKALETAALEREKSAEVLRNETQRAMDKADTERQKSADVLRNEQQRALAKADVEREKSADVLRSQLEQQIESGDQNLLLHIDNQKEQVASAFNASEKAIAKAEAANEKRFEAVNEFRAQLRDQQSQFVLRELFESTQHDMNRRLELQGRISQEQSIRLTEMEARGGGEKDHAADLKSTLAVGASITFGILSIAAVLLINFAG
jgi:hypothetical protein